MTTQMHADDWREIAANAQREAAEWRENFSVLQRALVGETGASGITVAHQLRNDAERYRWLRHGDNDERCIRLTLEREPYMLRGELLDRCIDEAMAADAEQEAYTVEGPGIGAA